MCKRREFQISIGGTSCYCARGFTGNPYIQCSDADECGGLNPCPDGDCVNLPGSYTCKRTISKKIKIAILRGVVIVVPLLVLVFAVWGSCRLIKKRRKRARKRHLFRRNGGLLLTQQLATTQGASTGMSRIFSSKELLKATNHFSEDRLLGQGAQGKVYKAMLGNGDIVAVKQSKSLEENKKKDFVSEIMILTDLNHRHIVHLIGVCLEMEAPVMVFEFIDNGNLYNHLHGRDEEGLGLSWECRLRIAVETENAIHYIHSYALTPLYHRDIKTSNILLDRKYRARLSDFGLSRVVPADQSYRLTVVAGTFGYLDPEFSESNRLSDKSDVFSFGVVLAELITGEKAVMVTQSGEHIGLASHFVTAVKENTIQDIVDTRIRQECKREQVLAVAKLARRCLSPKGRNRPKMREVSAELERIRFSSSSLGTLEEIVEEEAMGLLSREDYPSFNSLPCFDPSPDADPLIRLRTM